MSSSISSSSLARPTLSTAHRPLFGQQNHPLIDSLLSIQYRYVSLFVPSHMLIDAPIDSA